MRKFSTGALGENRHQKQEDRYREGHEYDYLIIGTGMSALCAGSLLANAGHRVCMLEAHDIPGGYAHNFEMNDFIFCAQVHYIWGCAPGQTIYEFLKHLGLENDVEFVAYDPDCYDLAALPDGNRVGVPYGFEKLINHIESVYPGQRSNLEKFVGIINKVWSEISQLPEGEIHWWQYMTQGYKFLNLIKYRNKTLQDVFNECGVSREAQAILNMQSGDFGSPPGELSFLAYSGLFSGYNEGAYYPKKHFLYFINRLVDFISEKSGCHIYYETEVSSIQVEGNRVVSVGTRDGKQFTADTVLCNMDPQKASHMIGRDKFPDSYLNPLSYDYAPSAFNIYLGVKGLDLREHGFGDYNIWSVGQWNLNQMWKEMLEDNHDNPLIFMSTPTLHTSEGGVAPDGCDILEVITLANHKYYKDLCDHHPKEYRHKKRELSQKLLDYVEERFLPGLQKNIVLKVVGTPTTNEDFCLAPYGNAYGSQMTPEYMGTSRLKASSPFSNFFWCNASSGFAGINGTVHTGMQLYMDLSGDRFFQGKNQPSADDAIRYAKSRTQKDVHKKILV